MQEWPTPARGGLRIAIKALERAKEQGKRFDHISKQDIFDLLGVPKPTAYRWLQQDSRRQAHSANKRRQRPGRPPSITEDDLERLEDYLQQYGYPARSSSWEDIVWDLGFDCTAVSLQRWAHTKGLMKYKAAQNKFLTKEQVQKRLDFAMIMYGRDLTYWKQVRFTDETHLAISQRNAEWVIRRAGERYMGPEVYQFKQKGLYNVSFRINC